VWWWIKQVYEIDRTYKRLFNDLADNLSENEFKNLYPKIQNFIFAKWKTWDITSEIRQLQFKNNYFLEQLK